MNRVLHSLTRWAVVWGGLLVPEIGDAASPIEGEVPALHSPADTAACQPVRPSFAWTPVPHATRYRIQAGVDSTFALPFIDDSLAVDTLLVSPVSFVNDTLIFWRVAAGDSLGFGEFSPPWRFRTGSLPRLSRDRIGFAETAVRDTSREQVTLWNPMPVPLRLDALFCGTRDFLVPAVYPDSLNGGDSLQCDLLFRPTGFGERVDTVVLHTEQGTLRLPLRGSSPPPVLAVRERLVGFGMAAVTDSVRRTLMVYNRGRVNRLTLQRLPRRTSAFGVRPLRISTIAPGDSTRIDLFFHVHSFLTNGYGVYHDTLTIDSDGGRVRLPLLGDSPPPRLRMESAFVGFGDLPVGDSAFATVRLWNASVNTLRIDTVRGRQGAFRPLSGRITVGARDTVELLLRFSPPVPGEFVDTLLIVNNSWTPAVRLYVNGVAPPPLIELDRTTLTFEPVALGEVSRGLVRLSNASISRLCVDTAGTRSRNFRIDGWNGRTWLRTGDTLTLSVTFRPDSLRHFSDTLTILSNASTPVLSIPLEGDGALSGRLSVAREVPLVFELFQNYPNPFNGSTTFRYSLPSRAAVRLEIYNTLGQLVERVLNDDRDAGFHDVPWQATVPSGTYYLRFVATPAGAPDKHFLATRKMLLMR